MSTKRQPLKNLNQPQLRLSKNSIIEKFAISKETYGIAEVLFFIIIIFLDRQR